MAAEKPRRIKLIIAGLTVTFMACVCCGAMLMMGLWSFNRAMVTDPEKLASLSAEIGTFTVPEGYAETFGMNLLGMEMIAITQDNLTPDSTLMMMLKVPTNDSVDTELLQKEVETALQQQTSFQQLTLTLDDVETRTINGQDITLTYRKGENSSGTPFRQLSTLIETDRGRVFFLAQGSAEKWDQHAIDVLLDSIH